MTSLPKGLTSPPPSIPDVITSFPSSHILQVTLNRPTSLNAIPTTSHILLDALWRWYDFQRTLRCAIITGTGRAFCAGADLKEWNVRNTAVTSGDNPEADAARARDKWATGGFGGLSNRAGKKPVIAAVNGLCLGGGMEMAVNCDLVVAAEDAVFGLPEVKRGVIALAGALPRIQKTLGKQRAAEMALVGGTFDARKMYEWGIVNKVVSKEDVVKEAIAYAEQIAENSPDSVIVSREGLSLGWEGIGPEAAAEMVERGMYGRMDAGENMREGVMSFVEKRKPSWRDSKL
ncbi:putative enoyl-CoA hydratase, mitochondrial [Cytospora mali]|uniref:Enoyl-CoA hydratase, mitochondrial n=1 Tax=Cytospora mali TaxID=578113 RepID=A0A194UTU0_CYTMA|nr:putative enoyl-CoA hydratase, mitochondrial [Valsa mali var. pyri (nom. inval.)]